jgi:flagellar motility protein MotE (MotC chaperone)
MRLRLLPATIAIGGLLLVSKSLGLAMAYLPGHWAVGESVVPLAGAASAAEATHGDKPEAKPGAKPKGPQSTPPATPAAPVAAVDPPPAPISAEERALLQDLRGRRQEWDAKDRALTERENVFNAAEQRLVARASELSALQTRLEQLEKSRVERDDANWTGLVKVYETMKPRDAASIFNDMDMPVLLQIVDRMKEAKTAAIFGAMSPDRARLLTAQLAAKRSRTTTVADPGTPAPDANSHS